MSQASVMQKLTEINKISIIKPQRNLENKIVIQNQQNSQRFDWQNTKCTRHIELKGKVKLIDNSSKNDQIKADIQKYDKKQTSSTYENIFQPNMEIQQKPKITQYSNQKEEKQIKKNYRKEQISQIFDENKENNHQQKYNSSLYSGNNTKECLIQPVIENRKTNLQKMYVQNLMTSDEKNTYKPLNSKVSFIPKKSIQENMCSQNLEEQKISQVKQRPNQIQNIFKSQIQFG